MAQRMVCALEIQSADNEWESVLTDSATPGAIREAKKLAREGVTVRLTISEFVRPKPGDSDSEIDESDSELDSEPDSEPEAPKRGRKAA